MTKQDLVAYLKVILEAVFGEERRTQGLGKDIEKASTVSVLFYVMGKKVLSEYGR